MSTRATYEFPNVTFYRHHDGYPLGAAAWILGGYLHREYADRKRDPGTHFLRAECNKEVEITSCHDAHGDTEYRYEVGSDWSVRFWSQDDVGNWIDGGSYSLREFVTMAAREWSDGTEDRNWENIAEWVGNVREVEAWMRAPHMKRVELERARAEVERLEKELSQI